MLLPTIYKQPKNDGVRAIKHVNGDCEAQGTGPFSFFLWNHQTPIDSTALVTGERVLRVVSDSNHMK